VKVLWIGDSHSEPGAGRNLAYWVPRMWPEAQVVVEGRRGWSTDRWADSGDIERLVDQHQPDLVVLALGGNDRRTSDEAWERDGYRALNQVRRGFASAGKVGAYRWVGPAYATDIEVGRRHNATAQQQKRVLSNYGITWVDSRRYTTMHHAPDGVHFRPDGYEAWARGAVRELKRGEGPSLFGLAVGGSVVVALLAGAAWWVGRD
jgi:lysophospholipase L1-like esterase